MKKLVAAIAIICLFLSMAALPGCETLARSFADQTGRNLADSLFGK